MKQGKRNVSTKVRESRVEWQDFSSRCRLRTTFWYELKKFEEITTAAKNRIYRSNSALRIAIQKSLETSNIETVYIQ